MFFFFFLTDFLHLTEQIDTFQLDNASATLASSLPLFSDRTICRDWHGRPNKELRSQPLLERRLQGMWCRSKLTSGWICDRQKYLEPSNLHTQVSTSPSSPPSRPPRSAAAAVWPPIAFGRRKEEVPFPLQAKVTDIKRFRDQFPLATVKTTLQTVRFECDSSAIWQYTNNQTAQSKKRLAVKTQPINPTSSHQLDSNFCKSKYKTN